MFKKLLCILVLMGSLGAQTTYQSEERELELNIIKLYSTLEKFIKIYEGCDPQATQLNQDTCKIARGHLDRKTFKQARDLAKSIFQLEEKK